MSGDCKDRYTAHINPIVRDLGGVAALGKSVFSLADQGCNFNSGGGLAGRRIANCETGIYEGCKSVVSNERRNAIGVSISHVGGCVINGADTFIRFPMERMWVISPL